MKFLNAMFWLLAGVLLYNISILLGKRRLTDYILLKFNTYWAN